jgi:F-type H+-transporting ATPase subunit b
MNIINTVYASNESVSETEVLATETYTTTEHGEETGGVVASLGINAQLFVFQLLNFAIVAAILWFLILKPLTKKLEDRKKIINDSLDKAQEVETNLTMSQQKFQEKIDEAKVEANKIIEKAYADSEKLSEEMKNKAKKEIELLVDQAKRNIQIEKEETIQGLKNETVNLIIAVVEKVLNEKITDKKDRELIEDSLKNIK